MAELIKAKFYPRQRLDLPDFNNLQDFVETDARLRNMYFLGGGNTPWVCRGFRVRPAISSGASMVDVEIAGSVLMNLTDTSDLQGVMYIGDPTLGYITDVQIVDGGVTNYIHVKLDRVTDSTATRTFWDPSLNNGLGGEYQYAVDTAEIKEVSIVVTQTAPSADPSHILVASAESSTGTISSLRDERNLFYRLAKNSLFTGLGGFTSPNFTPVGGGVGNDISVSGGFTGTTSKNYTLTIDFAGATDTFTWTDGVTTVTGVSITGAPQTLSDGCIVEFGATTGHVLGDTWAWVGVAATGLDYTLNLGSPAEPGYESITFPPGGTTGYDANVWVGADKELDNMKEWMDFVMSQIKEIKFGSTSTGTSWVTPAPTNLSSFGLNLNGGGVLTWACPAPGGMGTLTYTDDFVILLPGTAYSNYITAAMYPAGWSFPAPDTVAFVDIDKSSSANLTLTVVASASYVSATNRVIVARRIDDTIYVGI